MLIPMLAMTMMKMNDEIIIMFSYNTLKYCIALLIQHVANNMKNLNISTVT